MLVVVQLPIIRLLWLRLTVWVKEGCVREGRVGWSMDLMIIFLHHAD